MRRFFSILVKEFLQIIRDLPGLGLLFLMPAVMLLVITLTQEKVMTGMDSEADVLLVNSDMAALGNTIEEELRSDPRINLELAESVTEAEEEVFRGRYRVLVILPDSATERIEMVARQQVSNPDGKSGSQLNREAGIRLLYDPAIAKLYKDILGHSLQAVINASALQIYMEAINQALQPWLQLPVGQLVKNDLVGIEEGIAGGRELLREYNIVRNNVPAFILFAMFFIVIPLANSILTEKQQGTRDRLMTLPVPWFTLLSGKITLYLGVCLLQFFMMVSIGRYLLPVISTLPPLSLDVNIPALMAITVASGLAATGFGLLIGTLSSTFLQAAPIGSVLVVILAVLGGIFVPNYMMPDLISKISFISPLRWGTDALYNIFARSAGIGMVLNQFLSLLTFFIIALGLSFRAISKRA